MVLLSLPGLAPVNLIKEFNVKKAANFIYDCICKFESWVSMSCLTITVVVTVLNVFVRYILKETLPWANEVSGIAWTWTVMLGISWCFRRNMHMGVDFLLNKVSPAIRRWIQIISFIILFVANIFMLYMSIVITIQGGYKLTSYFQIPYAIKYISADIAFFNMVIYSAIFIVKGITQPDEFLQRVALEGNGLDELPVIEEIAGIPSSEDETVKEEQ